MQVRQQVGHGRHVDLLLQPLRHERHAGAPQAGFLVSVAIGLWQRAHDDNQQRLDDAEHETLERDSGWAAARLAHDADGTLRAAHRATELPLYLGRRPVAAHHAMTPSDRLGVAEVRPDAAAEILTKALERIDRDTATKRP
jgi:hypothetical protein